MEWGNKGRVSKQRSAWSYIARLCLKKQQKAKALIKSQHLGVGRGKQISVRPAWSKSEF